ncbi:caspase family protein, partial [Flavobacteriaceae bacterium]|nr:caspase family protein [Flavobacteriaceae bacterium]
YVDDKLQGEQIGYYESGEVNFKRNWVDDKLQGEQIGYYESGEVKSKINWVDGLRQGEEITYYESGEVEYRLNYVDDLRQGELIHYYESGEVESRFNYVDDLGQGEGIFYYESGEVESRLNLIDNLAQGEQVFYLENKEVDYTKLWIDGEIKERRIALVIGNAAYDKGLLENPVNDANLIAESLNKLGFDVHLHKNLSSRDEMLDAIKDFGRKRANYEIGFVYYAGHGIQLNNENYLLPVNEEFEFEDDVEDNGVSMQRVLRYLESTRENQLNFIVLDACRDNPFESNWNKTRSYGKGGGLTKISPPTGSLIAYSTDHGQTAADGDEGNSLYSKALAEKLLEEDVSIEQVFKNVRTEVLRLSNKSQSPVEESKLTGEVFYLNKKKVK